jgi:hypothetical protein
LVGGTTRNNAMSTHLYFRATVATYAALQPQIDAADREQPAPHKSFINAGHCEHILPQTPTIGVDGMAYIAVPAWLLGVNGAEQWASCEGVEEIDAATYQAAMPGGDEL